MTAAHSPTSIHNHVALPDHLQALLDPSFYPHHVTKVSLIQTHISWVFLTGNFAYKVKKPVDFGFLDFTTLQKRKKACLDELRLNRRLAPDIYLDVLSIYKSADSYLLGAMRSKEDQVTDYALKMVQFDQHDLFDQRLKQGDFNPQWMDQLAETVADFHSSAETGPKINHYGNPEFLLHHILENLSIAGQQQSLDQSDTPLDHLTAMSRKRFKQLHAKLKERQQHGYIRDCHGDLHLKNITLYNGLPTPFDCIEFSDEFRMIDTMSDVAFLIMDCDSMGRSDLGYRFLSRYLEQCGDYTGLALLPLYLSYRAGVRAKVSCLLANELREDGISNRTETENALYQASHYLSLAKQYLSNQQKPELIVIAGLSGSGKSHLSLLALEHSKAIIIRSDATRKRIANDHPQLPMYGNEMHKLTYQAMIDAAATTIKAGLPVILDATFLHPDSRESVDKLAARENAPFTFYWLDINDETLRERVRLRSQHGVDISDADIQVLEQQLSRYKRPDEPYIRYVDNSGRWPPKTTTAATP